MLVARRCTCRWATSCWCPCRSTPPPQARAKSGARRSYFEWYHKLGHELGHVVYDDYAMSLERNKTLRDRVKQSYQNETGLAPNDDPNLFKEWFADKAANEMIRTQTREGQSDPAFVRWPTSCADSSTVCRS